ncbi:hypothetical protein BDP27DRAFT_1082204 [Rhodocollybia butyracea]|uniref:Uncharacterized protein n=1 Tax=Rhodocollybia butyracea TaxID=206335 RepID=A0A9P5P147_9AGAR|nr:hypothetical protein BDP27DRAFT_1082204 [Rhodocollybia butyracea]
MTPEERQLVSAFGEEGFVIILNLILILTGYGAFILGFIIALQSLAIGSWGRPQTCLLVCLIINVDRYAFMQTLEQGVGAQTHVANERIKAWQATSHWPALINLLLSDGVVVWRASALYHQSKFWRFILAILMIANISLNVADSIWDNVNENIEFSNSAILDWLSVVFSMSVNMVATILFSYKAWNHHQYMRGLNGSLALRGTRAQKILNLLVESGVIFCTVQFMYIIVVALNACNIIPASSSQWPRRTAEAVFVTACACYPVAVIGFLLKDGKQLASSGSSIESGGVCFSTMSLGSTLEWDSGRSTTMILDA